MRQKGFTIVELIISIAILGAVSMIGVPSLSGVQTRSSLKSDRLIGAQIGQAALIKMLEDGTPEKYIDGQIKYNNSNIDAYISKDYEPSVMRNGYYVISQVKLEDRIVLLVGITKEGQKIEKTSIYDGKTPGWVWCQAGEIEKFLSENGDKIEDVEIVETAQEYIITAISAIEDGIIPSGENKTTSGKNMIFQSDARIDKESNTYFFQYWKIDGVETEDVGADNIYTFIDVQSNHTIEAVYVSADKYKLTVGLNNVLEMNANVLPGDEVTVGSNASSYNVSGIDNQATGTFGFEMPENEVIINAFIGDTQPEEVTEYTLTYNANGGNGAPASQKGKTITISNTKPTRSGYTFIGWGTSSSSTSASYYAGDSITLTANKTLYAVWQYNTVYTLSYNANGGSGAPSQQTGMALTISNTRPTRSGYTFIGWGTSSSSTSVSYEPGDIILLSKNTTLYAVWSEENGDTEIKLGDYNGDGVICAADYNECVKMLNLGLDIDYAEVFDMDCDGSVTIIDLEQLYEVRDYDHVVSWSADTCKVDRTYTITCNHCLYCYVEEYKADQHDFSDSTACKNAGCEAKLGDYNGDRVVCLADVNAGISILDMEVDIDYHEMLDYDCDGEFTISDLYYIYHNLLEYTPTVSEVPATCTTKGSSTATCPHCGSSRTSEISTKEHEFTGVAGCVTYASCTMCGKIEGGYGHIDSDRNGLCDSCLTPLD